MEEDLSRMTKEVQWARRRRERGGYGKLWLTQRREAQRGRKEWPRKVHKVQEGTSRLLTENERKLEAFSQISPLLRLRASA